MAPPLDEFPLSELGDKIQYQTVKLKPKRRKQRQWQLEDCELYELVQYTCTTAKEQAKKVVEGHPDPKRMDCFPFVRLFRRCGHGEKMFHVETTAWEGEHAYETPDLPRTEEPQAKGSQQDATNKFANYAEYFWSKK